MKLSILENQLSACISTTAESFHQLKSLNLVLTTIGALKRGVSSLSGLYSISNMVQNCGIDLSNIYVKKKEEEEKETNYIK